MRWKNKQKPENHDIRIIKRFLIIPVKINDEYRWMEKASIKQQYLYTTGHCMKWVNISWEDKVNKK